MTTKKPDSAGAVIRDMLKKAKELITENPLISGYLAGMLLEGYAVRLKRLAEQAKAKKAAGK